MEEGRIRTEKRKRIIWYSLLSIFVVILSFRAVYKSGAFRDEKTECNDFAVFYSASTALLKGGNPYYTASPEGRRYYYPPTFALILAPPARLGFDYAFILYLLMQMTASVVLIHLSFQLLPNDRRNPLLLFLLLLFLWRAFDSDFANGQINTAIAALALGGLYLVFIGERSVAGALLLALSISFKLYTAPLTLAFLPQGKWRAFLWTLLGIGIFVVILPSAFVGAERNSLYLGSFYSVLVSPYTSGSAPDVWRVSGQSLWAAMQRFFTATDAASHYHKPIFVNIVDIPPAPLWWLYLFLSSALLLFVLLKSRKEPVYSTIALLFCITPLIIPLARKAYFVFLTPCFLIAVWILLKRFRTHRSEETLMRKYAFVVSLCISFLLMVFTSRAILGKDASTFMLAVSCFTFGTIALFLSLLLGLKLVGQNGEENGTVTRYD